MARNRVVIHKVAQALVPVVGYTQRRRESRTFQKEELDVDKHNI